jgi:hypothetical protein
MVTRTRFNIMLYVYCLSCFNVEVSPAERKASSVIMHQLMPPPLKSVVQR